MCKAARTGRYLLQNPPCFSRLKLTRTKGVWAHSARFVILLLFFIDSGAANREVYLSLSYCVESLQCSNTPIRLFLLHCYSEKYGYTVDKGLCRRIVIFSILLDFQLKQNIPISRLELFEKRTSFITLRAQFREGRISEAGKIQNKMR